MKIDDKGYRLTGYSDHSNSTLSFYNSTEKSKKHNKNSLLIMRCNSISKNSIKARPISSKPSTSMSTKAIHFRDAYRNNLNISECSNRNLLKSAMNNRNKIDKSL